jgi:uncharacterized protein YndB with AHSA1/START domain
MKRRKVMKKSMKALSFKIERAIPAPRGEVFDGWLDPKIPGNPWNAAEKFLMDLKVDGLFYWTLMGTSHYGRFTQIKRPVRIRHTWVSPNTLGQESTVTVTFQKKGEDTLMTLVHSGLPDCGPAKGHAKGWNYFLGIFCEQFGNGSRRKYEWTDAHPLVKK